jgi:hypothetical protein
MSSRSLERMMSELSERMDSVQDWVQQLSKNIPDPKGIQAYLPGHRPKRGIGLPVMLAFGGLAFIGAVTLMSTTAQKKMRDVTPRRSDIEQSPPYTNEDRIEVNDLKPLTK